MVEASRVTVGTAAVELYAATGGTPARVKVANRGSASVFLDGDATVTTASGFELPAGASEELVLESGDELFGIAGTAGHEVHVLRT